MHRLPAPLPADQRTVGQLVGETMRAYGDNFWRALPLGIPLALATQIIVGQAIDTQIAVLCLFAPLFSAAFVCGATIVLAVAPSRKQAVTVWALGSAIWLPAPILLRAYLIPGIAWLAFWGLAVPVALQEGLAARAALGRARRLATADFVHALGSLCALILVVELSAGALSALLHGQGEATRRSAGFLALLVLSPLLYLGSALLYFDQAARVGSARSDRRSRRNADLHPPVDLDPAGSSDPQVEP